MNRNIINDWLQTHWLPLQELTIRYNIPLEEVVEIAGFYLLINCTIDIVHLYSQLVWYDNDELKKKISDLVCETF